MLRSIWQNKVYWHWQNLTTDDRTTRGGFWYGRAWLRLFASRWSVGWAFGKYATLFGMDVNVGGDEPDITIGCRIPMLFALYFSIQIEALRRYLPKDEHETGWWTSGGTLWINIWRTQRDWEAEDGWKFILPIGEWITGRYRYSEETISEHTAEVQLPEGSYPVKIRLFKSLWRYPRWWTKTQNRADIVMSTPIPIPARGISEDIGLDQDAIYEMTCAATTVEEALADLHATVMRDRERD